MRSLNWCRVLSLPARTRSSRTGGSLNAHAVCSQAVLGRAGSRLPAAVSKESVTVVAAVT